MPEFKTEVYLYNNGISIAIKDGGRTCAAICANATSSPNIFYIGGISIEGASKNPNMIKALIYFLVDELDKKGIECLCDLQSIDNVDQSALVSTLSECGFIFVGEKIMFRG